MAPSSPHSQARFLPGAMIAGRYRVVALLGRGGMGEVYRADDTKLGEAVALKFLPARLENDASLRERFLGEARLARQVAHPNVCRVYDVGEVEGRLFLSMEYVDGEDLATLLRRIGRLPEDKAVQIAHEICAGLQAAHEQGIVHRDLKPSNVMLDGRGRARITDFGLAALASTLDPGDVTAGTPAYMAPEQLAGQEVTVRSDVYALGLVLYELFTGRAAFEAAGWAEQLRAKQSTTPSALSQLTPGLDPAIERVVLRCLAPDPNQRPASAAAVTLALPGGDPLAAALAAGETPSPEMIAGTGDEERYRPAVVWGWFAAVIVALLVVFLLAPHVYLIQRLPIEKPPAVLVDRARDVAKELGWSEPPADESSLLLYDSQPGAWFAKRYGQRSVVEHLARVPTSTFTLLYRRSPRALIPFDRGTLVPTWLDPPLVLPGMLSLRLDGKGRLYGFDGLPVQGDTSAAPARHADWARVFALAGLDTADFRRVSPTWTPQVYADERLAWLGHAPGDSALALRIEAASFHGTPVSFTRLYPWSQRVPWGYSMQSGVVPWIIWIVFFGLLALAGWAARANLRSGSADARGALRLGIAAGLILLGRQWLGLHLAPVPQWLFVRFLHTIGYSAMFLLVVAILYLTLEPIVRRTWPHALVSWLRLLDGRWRDRRLGRDVLAGITAGIGLLLLELAIANLWTRLTGRPLPAELIDSPSAQTDAVLNTPMAITMLLSAITAALQSGLTGAALLALFTVLTRRKLPSLVLAGALMAVLNFPINVTDGVSALLLVVTITVMMTLMVRYGLVTLMMTMCTLTLLTLVPLVAPGASWYWPATAVALVFLLGLALGCTRAMLLGAPPAPAPVTRTPSRVASAPRPPAPPPARPASPPVPPSPPRPPDLSQAPTEISPRPGSRPPVSADAQTELALPLPRPAPGAPRAAPAVDTPQPAEPPATPHNDA